MSAGYSSTPLIHKLGIRPGMKLLLIGQPGNYNRLLGHDISGMLAGEKEIPDLIHLFAPAYAVFEKSMKKINALAEKNTSVICWVSWYKKASGIITDLTEDRIRAYALQHGWVDIKVCAVSELWSGLKLVVPLKKR